MALRGGEASVTIRSRRAGNEAFKSVEAQLERLNRKIKTAGVVAAGAAIGGIAVMTAKSFESVDALAKQSDKLGISTQKLRALQHLAELNGSSMGTMTEAITKAQKRLGEFNATGGGAAGKWLQRLNLDTRELASLAPDELFARYSDEISKLGSRGEQMAAISALMGDESRGLLNVIDQGSSAIADAELEVSRYGIALNRVDSAKIEAANDSLHRIKERMEGVANVIAARVAPIITAVANRILDTGTEADAMGAIVDKVMQAIAVGTGIVLDAFFGWKLLFAAIRVAALSFYAGYIGALAKVETAVIEVGNKIRDVFGGEQVDPATGFLKTVEDSLRASAEHAEGVLAELAASEKPSMALADAYERAKAAAEAAAVATAQSRSQLQEINVPTFEQSTQEEATAQRLAEAEQRERESLQRRLDQVVAHTLSKEELEILAFERRLEVVNLNIEAENITKERGLELERQLRVVHEQKLTDIANKGASERQKFLALSNKNQAKDVFSTLSNITSGVANSNKALFRINQAAAVGNAIVNTYEGVTKTLSKYPWPIAGILAATHLAAGLAQINAIRSASFGGGTTPSLAGSTPTFDSQPVPPTGSDPGAGGNVRGPSPIVQIVVHGNIIGDEGVREVIGDAIGEIVDLDGIIIPPDSRQAEEIRLGSNV